MTLPRNFPGRVNERRFRALERLEARLASGVKPNKRSHPFHNQTAPLTIDDEARMNREMNALGLAIRPVAQARAVRTKKNRTGTGKLTRAA